MKKIPFVLVMALIASILTTTSNAQFLAAKAVSTKDTRYDNGATLKSSKEEAKTAQAAVKLTKAYQRATKDFNKEFKAEQKVTWFNEGAVISASFEEKEIKTTVFYDRKGSWLRTMKVYKEDKLQRDIRKLVKVSDYYDYAITLIQEFKEGEITFYVVHLEDATSFKQVAVYDGQINLINTYNKQL